MQPLVSCITPCHRVSDYENLIANFERQKYPNRELIVVLDWGMPVVENADNVTCIYTKRGSSIGSKRNSGNTLSKGSIIAHFDSDDWYGELWLEQMVEKLSALNCDITGLDTAIFQSVDGDYLYEYGGVMPYVLGATMVYKKEAWERYLFQDISEGEDARWLAGAGRCKAAERNPAFWHFKARITGYNTCSHRALNTMKKWQP